jgi:ABC-type uncharacterized transport system permease subunit
MYLIGKMLPFLRKPMYLGIIMILLPGILISYYIRPVITVAVLASAIRQSTPLVLGALCGLLGERSGVINIGIEGQMLSAAFASFMIHVWSGNLFLAVCAGMITGAVMGYFLSWMSINLKIDQIIGGTVMNILALGVTGYYYHPGLITHGKLPVIPLGPLRHIPLAGPVLFNNPPITYIAIILVFVVHAFLFNTRWGLRTRAIGEHPGAARAAGIQVHFLRHVNLALGGIMAGLAGAFLTLEAVGSFERAMTNGRGFVALAIMIFGKWTPLGAWAGALLFGLATALQTQLQFSAYFHIPHQFIGMMPYLITVLILCFFVGRSRPPAALGIAFEKEGQ